MRSLLLVALIGALAIDVSGQTARTGGRRFDGATIRANVSDPGGSSVGTQPGGGFVGVNATPMMVITTAYRIRDYQVVGAPGWIASARYDIQAIGDVSAIADAPGRRAALEEMARNLLADRFHLKAHRDRRPIETYALSVARRDRRLGPRLMPATKDCAAIRAKGPPGAPRFVDGVLRAPECGTMGGGGSFETDSEPIAALVNELEHTLDGPVIDHTGLTGNYSISLTWRPDPTSAADVPPLPAALLEQLGLKLERRKEPYDVLVIDRFERPQTD